MIAYRQQQANTVTLLTGNLFDIKLTPLYITQSSENPEQVKLVLIAQICIQYKNRTLEIIM